MWFAHNSSNQSCFSQFSPKYHNPFQDDMCSAARSVPVCSVSALVERTDNLARNEGKSGLTGWERLKSPQPCPLQGNPDNRWSKEGPVWLTYKHSIRPQRTRLWFLYPPNMTNTLSNTHGHRNAIGSLDELMYYEIMETIQHIYLCAFVWVCAWGIYVFLPACLGACVCVCVCVWC